MNNTTTFKNKSIDSNGIINRDSNFELYRIIIMIAIVAHHYVVNSSLVNCFDFNSITPNMIFLQVFGFGGKTGINCFVFLTGYFMCKSNFKWTKLLKLYLEIKFYRFSFYIIFLISGYETFTLKSLTKTVFNVAYGFNLGFVGTFIVLYILVPFINILIKNMTKKQHVLICIILFTIYSILPSLLFANIYDNLTWFVFLYLISSFIRLYDLSIFNSKKIGIIGSTVSIFLSFLSIVVVDFIGSKFGFKEYYHLLINENKILALSTAFFLFLLFKNIKIKHSKTINVIASSTFGVFLIHANSATMRRFLWIDLFKNVSFYNSSLLVLHAITSVICIFVFCTMVDQLRIKLLEKPLFNLIYKKQEMIEIKVRSSIKNIKLKKEQE